MDLASNYSPSWTVDDLQIDSSRLGRPWRVLVQRPLEQRDLPWIWILHGRTSSADEMRPLLRALAEAMDAGTIPSCVVAAPDAPDGHRESWWVDSDYEPPIGAPPDELSGRAGLAIETSLLTDLVPAVEAHYGAVVTPADRIVAGISMGGAAALRWLLVRPDLFGSAILLSPAVFQQSDPPGSAMRTPGPYNIESSIFDTGRYAEVLHYPTLLERRPPGGPVVKVVTLVGDGELPRSDGTRRFDLDLEAARLHAILKIHPGFESHLRVVEGVHDWPTWERGVVEALAVLTAGRDENA